MNLWLRLVWFFVAVRSRPKLGFLEVCETHLRCSVGDLDIYAHMNNGRYLTLMDIGRAELVIRAGLWDRLVKAKMFLVVEGLTIRYRKSLMLGDRFRILTRVVGWNGKSFFLRQTFMRGEEVVADAVVKGRVLRRSRGTVPPADVLRMLGIEGVEPPPLSAFVQQWDEGLQGALD